MSMLNKVWVLGSAKWSVVEGSYIVSGLYIRDVAITLSVLWVMILEWKKLKRSKMFHVVAHIAYLRQQCHNSKFEIFQEKSLKVSKCYNFLWVQRRHNCSPGASIANCVMTLCLLKVHLQTFISIPITKKCQILSCDTLVANERYDVGGCWMNEWMNVRCW